MPHIDHELINLESGSITGIENLQNAIVSLHEWGPDAGLMGEAGTHYADYANPRARTNLELAQLALALKRRNPRLAIVTSVVGMEALSAVSGEEFKPDHVVEGSPANTVGGGKDTWVEVNELCDFMAQDDRDTPIILSQRHHIRRVVRQFDMAAMEHNLAVREVFVPARLPAHFAPSSAQWWIRNQLLWTLHEAVGVPVLMLKGRHPGFARTKAKGQLVLAPEMP